MSLSRDEVPSPCSDRASSLEVECSTPRPNPRSDQASPLEFDTPTPRQNQRFVRVSGRSHSEQPEDRPQIQLCNRATSVEPQSRLQSQRSNGVSSGYPQSGHLQGRPGLLNQASGQAQSQAQSQAHPPDADAPTPVYPDLSSDFSTDSDSQSSPSRTHPPRFPNSPAWWWACCNMTTVDGVFQKCWAVHEVLTKEEEYGICVRCAHERCRGCKIFWDV